MELTIKIKMTNAAFENNQAGEVLRILTAALNGDGAAEMLYHGGKMTLRDINGNTVGKAVVSVEG